MDAKDAIKSSMQLCSMVLKTYVGDLDDADLMCRPSEGCNHLAWQMGHLISSEVQLLQAVAQSVDSLTPEDVTAAAELPEGFIDQHSKENCGLDDSAAFCSKEEYVTLLDRVRQASAAALEQIADADLDCPAPENMRSFCPTIGDMFNLIATHPMMHAGQFVIVRRKLDKPILM